MEDKKYAIITGATSGIGIPTAIGVAKRGYHTTLICRNPAKGEALKQRIVAETGNHDIDIILADLTSLEDVSKASQCYIDSGKPLHLLINNAGIINTTHEITQDGYEAMFAVNYLSVFLLTTQLLPVLKSSGNQDNSSRIVNVTSEGYKMARRIDFENINAEKGFKTFPAYGHSKLALMLFNLELAEQLSYHPVNTYAVHPGAVNTNLGSGDNTILSRFLFPMLRPFFKTPEQGAATTLHVAFEPKADGQNGFYYASSKVRKLGKQAKDSVQAKTLWSWTDNRLSKFYN
ncbi:SDR family oxidoreductase [Endozoicomonas atrinae]|uniref:SDR family oxidoreductase n=1 Tax=Endozoicomonas atrinae TaxID=1333660 RepID=UPI00082578BC|nr:SDR family oxidoreductase [Endozoicomonas atrinae]